MISTTTVRIAVARFEFMSCMPIFASMAVAAANTADNSANTTHILFPPRSVFIKPHSFDDRKRKRPQNLRPNDVKLKFLLQHQDFFTVEYLTLHTVAGDKPKLLAINLECTVIGRVDIDLDDFDTKGPHIRKCNIQQGN